jgi:hypothetical protein
MSEVIFSPNQRLTRKQKEANEKHWYKEQVNTLDKVSFAKGGMFGFSEAGSGISEYRRMKVNYDLFNNIINKTDFEHVCYPFGKEVGELPADFTNKDIVSGKIKALLGMEMRRPFSWKVVATNEEATTRREQEEFSRLRDFVISSIMNPIKADIEKQYAQQSKGKELTPDEQEKIQQQIAQELQTKTPPEVKRYMEREHQDPAEALSHQLLEYLVQKEDVKMKFNKAWKHGLIAGREIFWVGVINGEPVLKVVNPLRFDYDKSPDLDYIEDGEWACYEMYMTPSEVIRHFGQELTPTEMDEIYSDYSHASSLPDSSFTFRNDSTSTIMGIRVIHCEWKSLKPLKFVKGIDPETGEEYEDMVDESYQLNKEVGDIEVTTEWIPAKFEGYKIGEDKYAYLREVPGQNKDLDNLYHCKLSYVGATYDNLNSEVTSLVDRMKYYQYMYNILLYRIELLIASDDGKSLLLNAGLIPKSAGLDIEKWMYYFKVNKIGLMDPSEEGNKGNQDITQAAKEIDMSLVSDIQKYIQLAEYIERRCGESVGITKAVEGQIGTEDAVRNTQQALVQSANILEPYFELHNNIKRNVLQALIECAKVAYSEFQPNSISYVLDDMSRKMISMDYDLLDNSTYGIFVSNSMKSDEALQMVQQLSHAALQNQKIELSDVIKIMRSESIQEAEELLKVAEKERIEREQAMQQQQFQAQAESEEKQRQFRREEWDFEMKKMEREEELKTERELQKQAILSMGFNEDKDLDKDGTPDVLEIYKAGVDANIKQAKLDLDKAKLEQQKKEHIDNVELENKKIKTQAMKNKVNTK